MPKTEKVMCRAINMPGTTVWPTEKMADDSVWKRISHFNIPKTFSLTPEYYAITICGEAYNYNISQVREVETQRVVKTYHPYIALGKIVLEFFKNNSRASITSISILKRCEK